MSEEFIYLGQLKILKEPIEAFEKILESKELKDPFDDEYIGLTLTNMNHSGLCYFLYQYREKYNQDTFSLKKK